MDCSLEIDTAQDLAVLSRLAAEALGLPEVSISRDGALWRVAAAATWITLSNERERDPQFAAAFGFTANTVVSFRLDKFRDIAATSEVFAVSLHVLNQVAGDAVLLFNGEFPLLLRKGGEWTLNSNASEWHIAPRIRESGIPFKYTSLPRL